MPRQLCFMDGRTLIERPVSQTLEITQRNPEKILIFIMK